MISQKSKKDRKKWAISQDWNTINNEWTEGWSTMELNKKRLAKNKETTETWSVKKRLRNKLMEDWKNEQ